jgi:hypothetical protein
MLQISLDANRINVQGYSQYPPSIQPTCINDSNAMKTVRIIALFLLGANAAFAQAVSATRVTDSSDIKCPQSFCDAFFDDQSICEFTGTHAMVYERDGMCGIEMIDAVITCSVPCYALFANTDETKRGEGKVAPEENTMFILQIIIAMALTIGIVVFAVWQFRRYRDRIEEGKMRENVTNASFGKKGPPTLPRSVRSIASAYTFMSQIHVATESIKEEDEEESLALKAAAASIEEREENWFKNNSTQSPMEEDNLSDGFRGIIGFAKETPLFPMIEDIDFEEEEE